MEIEILEKVGLTKGESKVYLVLLKLGPSTVGQIVKEANVSNSKIYDILDRLNKKGLVGTITINNRKNFEAKDPLRLKDFIELKRREIEEEGKKVEELIPKLQQIRKYAEPVQEAEILQGINGIKTFSEMILNRLRENDVFYILGVPKEANELLGAYFKDWHKRRIRKKIRCKILYNQEAREWAEERKRWTLTEVKFLPKQIKTPAIIDIGKDCVATILFGDRPLCFLIKNKKIADSYKNYFELLWEVSK